MEANKKEVLISHCGFYCGACPQYKTGKCEGCRGDSPGCAVGYRKCLVKPCCTANNYFTCADCLIYPSVKKCSKYNPLLVRFGEWISSTSRREAIEMIRENGLPVFLDYMTDKDWVTVKTKDTCVNSKLGKKRKTNQ